MEKVDIEKIIMDFINEGKFGSAGSVLSKTGDELPSKDFNELNRRLKSCRWEASPSGQQTRRRRLRLGQQ